jgi:DNA-directed RNA polymerase specialized sigma24 family protein
MTGALPNKRAQGRERQGEDRSLLRSNVIAQHLPYLRRYARALTGSQASGDAYVSATLEALIKDPTLLSHDRPPRIGLFRVLSAIWNSVAVNAAADPLDETLAPERHLSQVSPKPRQAFLLVSVEGFSEEDAAYILDVDEAELRDLIEESGRELAAQIATDILIIEDETVIAVDLEEIVETLGHRVIGVARTRSEAIALARIKSPGLILSDIQLADGSSGLEAVNELLNAFEVPVIFITAFPERFLSGERPEPAFLISKPYQRTTILAVISQALFFERNATLRKKKATS